jgi:hypothetical protein
MFPSAAAISASTELVTVLLLRLILSSKVAPLSFEALNITSPSPLAVLLVHHTTYVDSLVPKQIGGVYHVDDMLLHVRKEKNNELQTRENHTRHKFDNHYSWLWNLMDSKTRFWICSTLSQKRDTVSSIEVLKDMKKSSNAKSICP